MVSLLPHHLYPLLPQYERKARADQEEKKTFDPNAVQPHEPHPLDGELHFPQFEESYDDDI